MGNAVFWCIGAVTALLIGATGWQAGALSGLGKVNPLMLTAGAMGASLVFGIAWIIPQIGAQHMTVMLLTGQILSAMVLSNFGWLGSPVQPVSVTNMLGAVLLIGGAFLATRMTMTRRIAVASVVAVVLACVGRAQSMDGDVRRGQALFEGRGACLDCHRVGTRGSRFGPDLTDIGARAGTRHSRAAAARPPARGEPGRAGGVPDPADPERAREKLERALTDPGADILPPNRTVRLVTRDGETITARVLNQDTFSLQLIDTKERLLTVQRSDLREFAWIKSSSMPSYRDKLTAGERADLIAYLLSLKGINK